MARRRKPAKFFRPVTRAGWYYPGGRRGLFCPVCGEGLYSRRGIHPYLFCVECGWEENTQVSLEALLGRELAAQVRAKQLGGTTAWTA